MESDVKNIPPETPTTEDNLCMSDNVAASLSGFNRLAQESTISLFSPGQRGPAGDPCPTSEASLSSGIDLCMIDKNPFTRECISSCLRLLDKNLRVTTFSSIDECITAGANDFDVVLWHIHCDCLGQQEGDKAVASLKPAFRTLPVIILSDMDGTELIMEAFESGARGYIPTGSTSVAIAVEVIHLVRAGGIFVPPSSLRMMQHSPSSPKLILDEPLTSRQMAVLQHLAKGKSNKVIAYDLEMSESTVKVHIRNIMKKMRATNRTEVACRAHNLWLPERQRRALSSL